MKRRPDSISAMGYFLVLASVALMVQTLWMYNPPGILADGSPAPSTDETDNYNLALLIVGVCSALTFASAVGFLRGYNWGRWLFTVLTVFWIIVDLGQFTQQKMYVIILGQVIRVLFVILLFTPKANRFFEPDPFR